MSAADPVRIRPLAPADRDAWDAFVLAHPRGSLFHLSAWARAVEEALGQETPFLCAERAGRIVGVLPLVAVRGPLFGRALVSTGFTVGGGPHAEDDAIAEALVEAAERLARERGFARLELRCPPPARPGWQPIAGKHLFFRKPLDPDPEVNFRNLRRKQRAVIRKAREHGLRIEIDSDCTRFFPLYAASVHRLGTPVLPRAWFAALARLFGERCELATVLHRDRPVAALLSFYFRDAVLPYYAGSLPEARALGAHDFMYDALMRRAVARGCRLFDFGRSKVGSGHAEFKKHWGASAEPVVYAHWSPVGRPPPDLDPRSERNRLFVRLWRRLPAPLANRLGPWIARQIG
ncbi:MAG: FemAB family PEP-CTERM system-associated protein [Geminicoccaceae bacterium]|nr:FemAB family PEP-CTERM system-associated protein [Geminicoccaceae bacterium]